MSSPLVALKSLLNRQGSTTSTVLKGSGMGATVTGNAAHPKALPGDTLLVTGGRVIRLPKAPDPISK